MSKASTYWQQTLLLAGRAIHCVLFVRCVPYWYPWKTGGRWTAWIKSCLGLTKSYSCRIIMTNCYEKCNGVSFLSAASCLVFIMIFKMNWQTKCTNLPSLSKLTTFRMYSMYNELEWRANKFHYNMHIIGLYTKKDGFKWSCNKNGLVYTKAKLLCSAVEDINPSGKSP